MEPLASQSQETSQQLKERLRKEEPATLSRIINGQRASLPKKLRISLPQVI